MIKLGSKFGLLSSLLVSFTHVLGNGKHYSRVVIRSKRVVLTESSNQYNKCVLDVLSFCYSNSYLRVGLSHDNKKQRVYVSGYLNSLKIQI